MHEAGHLASEILRRIGLELTKQRGKEMGNPFGGNAVEPAMQIPRKPVVESRLTIPSHHASRLNGQFLGILPCHDLRSSQQQIE